MYLGDFKEDGDIFHKFSTRAFATGIPTLLAGSPAVLSVYKDEGGAASEKTTSESYFDLDVSHDSIAGFNNVRMDLSGDAFFATGADYAVVITTGTVGGVSVVGEVLFTFSIENRSMGQPVGATLAADIAAIKSETALIVGDTDVIDDGTSGLVKIAQDVAAVLADTGTDGVVLKAAGLATDAADEIAAAVWDEDATGHQTGGTFGQAIGDPAANTETMYDAVVTDATGTNVAADVVAVKAQTVAIEADTDVIDDGTSGLVKIASDVAAIKVPTDKLVFTVSNQVDANMLAISGDTTAADNLEEGATGLVATTVNDASASTTAFVITSAEATDDHFNGRIITFTSGDLVGQSTDITDYTGSSKTVTVTALTEAPANGVSFVIS